MSTLKKPVWAVPGLLGLVASTVGPLSVLPAIAQTTDEMVAKAEKACLDVAVAKGYSEKLSKVISSKSLDADTVQVVLNLTRDGSGFDRLTCPFSVTKGTATLDLSDAVANVGDAAADAAANVGNAASDAAANVGNAAANVGNAASDAAANVGDAAGDALQTAESTVATATETLARPRFPWWWLLLPLIGLPLLLLWARGREDATVATGRAAAVRDVDAYVHTQGGYLSVHARPDGSSDVLRSLEDGAHVHLTGRRDDIWVELKDGGWVDSRSLRFPEGVRI